MADKRRRFRIAEKIREVVARYLLLAGDESLPFITITNVQVSPDLRHAKVYWMVHSQDDILPKSVGEWLVHHSGRVRHAVAQELNIRFVPELAFIYDNTLDVSDHVESLMRKVEAKRVGMPPEKGNGEGEP